MAKNLITTPKGRAVFPHLHAPDTKFDSNGVYTIKVDYSPSPERDAFIAKVDALVEEAYNNAVKENPKIAKKIKRAECYEEQENGDIRMNFKMKATGQRKDKTTYTQKPALFDAQGRPVQGINVGGGSTVRVSFDPFQYLMASSKEAGISLRLKAVQIINLVEFGGGNADYFGFGTEDDGFDSTERAVSEPSDEDEDSPEASDEDEDGDF